LPRLSRISRAIMSVIAVMIASCSLGYKSIEIS
jgi:hypothetical protein